MLMELAPQLSAYDAVHDAFAAERCVILDGGAATGEAPDAAEVVAAHRRYIRAGCDVITTDTRGLLRAADDGALPQHWIAVALRSVRLARQAIAEEGRDGKVAVAFSIDADIDRAGRGGNGSAAAPCVRRRAARSRGGRGPDRRAPDALPDRRGAAGRRAARLAVFPSLSPRAVRGLRPALGRPGGRRVRAGGAALRGARGRRAAAGLHPTRPRRRNVRPTCATSPTCRSASTPTAAISRAAAGSSTPAPGRPSSPAWPCAGARRVRS